MLYLLVVKDNDLKNFGYTPIENFYRNYKS